ncbi:MAG: hypothetical protein EBQ96_07935 [Proteobacteria bacterium]|nr:hypothetical protein [Pseudomonadota bacterium]
MLRIRETLVLCAALAVMAAAPAMAQQGVTPTAQPAPLAAPPVGAVGAELPFISDGANQPVLQTISPDGQAIAPEAMVAPMAAGGDPHAADAHGDGHAKKAGLPQFDVTTFPKQLFWLALTFVFLYVMYSKVTLPRIGSVIENRASKVAEDLRAAEQLKADVERVRSEYEAAITAAQSDAQKQIASVQADIKRLSETQDAAFKAKAESAIETLEKKIDVNRTRALAELNSIAAELAVDIAARVAGVKTDKSAAQAVIDGTRGKAKAA